MQRIVEIHVNNESLKNPIKARYCDTFKSRLKGLMFRRRIETNEGLLLVQNHDSKSDASIHMLAVFMDLAIIWIDSNFSIVDIKLAKSWRLAYFPARPAMYTLEIHPERISEFKVGDTVSFNDY
jgi:uncharacterized membrane protein (UPF0127 family)